MKLRPAVLQRGFYLVLFLVGVVTFAIHEFAHWAAGMVLGYDMVITPNRVFSKSPTSFVHAQVISLAGPIVTYTQAVIGFYLVRKTRSLPGFAMVYMAFFMRFFAAVISIFNPNDEARVSEAIGIGSWTLPAVVVIALFGLIYFASRRLHLTVWDHIYCYLAASMVVTLVVGIDSFFFV